MKQWQTKNSVRIHRVLQGRCNCYLVGWKGRYLLVDTGRTGSWKKLAKGLSRLGVSENSSLCLALTHCHFDHAENAARVKRTCRAPILVHRSEADLLKTGENPDIRGTMPCTRGLTWLLSKDGIAARIRYEPADGDVLVDDTLPLEPYGIPGYLLHTPGHTPGSISAIIDDEIAIVGDAMVGVFKNSVLPPFAVDVPLLVQSWKRLLDAGCKMFLPAHGAARTAAVVRKNYGKYSRRYNL